MLCDIQGPKIRTGKMKEPFEVAIGDKIRVTNNPVVGTPERIQISYETLGKQAILLFGSSHSLSVVFKHTHKTSIFRIIYLVQDLDAGDVIFINDGTVKLEVEERDVTSNELICEVKTSGKISDNKGCNMPSGQLSVDVVTEKDAADLAYIANNLNPEYVAASFVGSGDDVRKVRSVLAKAGNTSIKIIAKLERQVALDHLEEIIKESDAVSTYIEDTTLYNALVWVS